MSDWIAVAAVIVAIFGFWQGRRSANAAAVSAHAATKALDIAEQMAELAAISARAAERSADAESRATAIVEASFHQELAPKWLSELGQPTKGACVLRLRFEDGPAEVAAHAHLFLTLWGYPNNNGVSEQHLVRESYSHPCLHPSEVWEVRIDLPSRLKIQWAQGIVSIDSEPWPRPENEALQHSWSFQRALHTRKRPPPGQRFF